MTQVSESQSQSLLKRYAAVRQFTETLVEPLSAEDSALQSMADASPSKWHLAHTTWFFETFVLRSDTSMDDARSGYRVFDDSFAYLYNSYYNTIGKQFPRPQRGLISRPSLSEVLKYRRHVDQSLSERMQSDDNFATCVAPIVEIGLQHEQQHQELILTDIKHLLSKNPLQPIYRTGQFDQGSSSSDVGWRDFDEGIYWIGFDEDAFSFDNESPRHRVWLDDFQIADSLVTCGRYQDFIDDGGYERPEFWLSLGWQTVCDQRWTAPLYWHCVNDQWHEFTLAGSHRVDPNLAVCHVSYFEADAFARWAGARLPTEAEWEVAAASLAGSGNLVDQLWKNGSAIHPGTAGNQSNAGGFIGDVWQWTASPYVAYPGYTPPEGALGEYNGKFMCNQYVLRGGSCATSSTHIRETYRNFFPPEARWQFSGIRLCR